MQQFFTIRTDWRMLLDLLKEEMRLLDSLLMKCADQTKVPAGGALAVDREEFSEACNRGY